MSQSAPLYSGLSVLVSFGLLWYSTLAKASWGPEHSPSLRGSQQGREAARDFHTKNTGSGLNACSCPDYCSHSDIVQEIFAKAMTPPTVEKSFHRNLVHQYALTDMPCAILCVFPDDSRSSSWQLKLSHPSTVIMDMGHHTFPSLIFAFFSSLNFMR